MNGALRLSEAFILGLHAACYLAGLGGGRASTAEIARYLGVSEAHLAKVMQRLVRAGLLKSVRGPGGGFALTRQSSDISLLDIYESLEGPFSPTTCLLGRDACLGRSCVLSGLLKAVDERFESYLRETHLGSVNILSC
ncbi:MAG: RrF2 family transcriptional regulator [Actinomycetota bacterium]